MLEQIVRPYQSRSLFGQRRVPSSSKKEDAQESSITWGAAGALPEPRESPEPGPYPGISFVVKGLNQRNLEIERETKRVKLQQEDNPDNFVVLERTTKIKFKDPKPRYLKSPESPDTAYADAKAKGFVPGPGDPQEIPVNSSWPPPEVPIQFDTHEYVIQEHPGANETPL
jgi:hypothetical protein